MTSSNLAIEKGTCCGELTHPTWRKAKSFIIFKMVGRYVSSQEGTMFFSLGLLLTKPYLRSDGEWHLVKWQSNPVKGDGERPYQAKNSWDFSQISMCNHQAEYPAVKSTYLRRWVFHCVIHVIFRNSRWYMLNRWYQSMSTNQRPQVQRLQCCCILFCLAKALQLVQGLELWSRSSMAGAAGLFGHQQNDHLQKKNERIYIYIYIVIYMDLFQRTLTSRIIPRIQH